MSQNLIIEETIKTPEIRIDVNAGTISIKGRSLPEDAIEFYEPIVDFIQDAQINGKFFTVKFALEYINTSSASIIRTILEYFQSRKNKGELDFVVEWCFEEDDFEMEETGKHYEQTIPGLPVKFIEVDSI